MTYKAKPENPFVGLRAFEEDEDYLFFGRSAEINDLLMRFSRSRFLAVIGSSGSGKSSLVKSGLLPAIHGGFLSSGHNWHIALMRPEDKPIENLALALSKKGVLNAAGEATDGISYLPIIESTLRRSSNGLPEVYSQSSIYDKNKSGQAENLLVVVDQFEELFRFNSKEKEKNKGESQSLNFVNLLLTATAETQTKFPVYVLITMRSDFLGDCSRFRGLPEAINNGQYLVPRMTRDEIKEAITGPIAIGGAQVTQRLVTRLLNDTGDDIDQLPVLQHALMRTWNKWPNNPPGTPIDIKDYEESGTLKEALSRHANEAFAELKDKDEQKVCELMFKALTDKTADARGIRRPRKIADLCVLANANEEQVKKVIEVFRKPGRTFLMPPPGTVLTGESVIDISHESLMRVWDKLKTWADEEARDGDIYKRLVAAAERAENLRKEQGLHSVLVNPELDITLSWFNKNKPTAKWAEGFKGNFEQAMAYLKESQEADLAVKKIEADKEAARKRLWRAIFILVGLVMITAIVFALIFRNQKNKETSLRIETENAKKSDSVSNAKAIAANRIAIAALKSDSLSKANAIAANNTAIEALRRDSASKAEAIAANQAKLNALRLANESALAEKLQREKADSITKITIEQNLKIAANEYARLIRDGPSDENNNKNEFYGNNYFLAYRHHFDQLEDSLAIKKDTVAYNSYKSLKNKLYYNNDLYKRAYENLVFIKHKADVIEKNEKLEPATGEKRLDNTTTAALETNNKGRLTIVRIRDAGITTADSLSKKGQEFISLAVSEKQRLVLCSTNDNLIYVFNDKLRRRDTISMGARVTALDFFDDHDHGIIYFGTASGYIGYIYYDMHKKNQPVFENKLETAITAVQLFTRFRTDKNNRDIKETFLLAAATQSNPRVYKLDDNSLKPDKLLFGNELPYSKKEYGDITRAGYLSKLNMVMLVTSNGIYLWNPFTRDLLDKLEEREKENLDQATIKATQYY